MAEQEQDRSEQATPYKLEQARKKGSVAKSQDAVYVAVLAALLVFIYGFGWQAVNGVLKVTQTALVSLNREDWTVMGVSTWLSGMLIDAVSPLLPLVMALIIAAVLASVAQTGPLFSFHPIQPDFTRLNPATGFKRVFSLKMVYEGGKSVLKLLVVATVLTLVLSELPALFVSAPYMDVRHYAQLLLDQGASLIFKLALAMMVLAVLDMSYTRWEFMRQMRMSKREVKDEHKQREGDPRIRSRLREIRLELLKRSKGLTQVPEADVLITNPVHYAVAVKYRHGEMLAPQVVAKGAGNLARKMREVAARHNVVVVQNPPLARALFRQVETEQYVPETLYPQVAKILVWVYAMRRNKAAEQGSAA